MMSRYSGSARDRDRSPPRPPDRRPSATYHSPTSHMAFRGGPDPSPTPNREIPRGPKADTLRHAPPTSRGRGGFGPRSDFRDRDVAQPSRRETDRPDWSRREGDFPGNDRERLSSRDARPFYSRDRSMSPNRVGREAKDVPPIAPRISDPPPIWHGSSGRSGSLRPRGRTEWDRGRGRPFLTERDGFGPRSRSREGWRDRNRDRERPETDHRERFERRDNERSLERDDRDREPASWRQHRSPSHGSAGNQAPSSSRPTTAAVTLSSHAPTAELDRRFSTTLTPTGLGREARYDHENGECAPITFDTLAAESKTRRAISPPSAPTVPAFGGSLEYFKPTQTPLTDASSENVPPSKPANIAQSSRSGEKPAAITQDVPFQPPTGPKADRGAVAAANPFKEPKALGPDLRAKPEIQPRPPRSTTRSISTASVINPPQNESWESFAATAASNTSTQKHLSLKPIAATASSTRSMKRFDPPLNKAMPPKAPAGIPTGPAAKDSSPTHQRPAIPTGPRIQQKQYPHPWTAPGYKLTSGPTRPSIMNSAPSKPPQAAHRERNYGLPVAYRKTTDPFVGQNIKTQISTKSVAGDTIVPLFSETANPGSEQETEVKDGVLLPIPMGETDTEEAEEDDDGLDEEGFADSERMFRKEIDLVEAKRPLSPLRDPVIVGLLVRVQLLGMIADGSAPAGIKISAFAEAMETTGASSTVGLPSPVAEGERQDSPQPSGRLLKELPYNPIPTPPIEDLPFLSKTTPGRLCTFENSDEDSEMHETVVASICEGLSLETQKVELQHLQLKKGFSDNYRSWRTALSSIDHKKREENPQTPTPASPPLTLAPTVLPTPLIERTRGAKNITELDLQNILKASEQSAREEQERRDRELTSRPNYEMEAVIPAMMEQHETELSFFEDRNEFVPEGNSLDVFAFVPPQDDFSAEEQKVFIAAFNAHPKKWSEIAECLPGRDFQQCILHYYLTKHTAKYKDLWRKTLPKKKRGRGPPVRPRSTALMSDLVFEREEVDGMPAAVTDTGRPRRAAAPTFGEQTIEMENTAIPATASRRSAKDSNGEQPSEKVVGKRRAGPKGSKKNKTATGPVGGPSPQKIDKELTTATARTNAQLDPLTPKADEGLFAGIQRGVAMDTELNRPPTLLATLSADSAVPGRPASTARNAVHQSSYWSRPETDYFPNLVDYFGRDWTGISSFMETKTSNMVSLLLVSSDFGDTHVTQVKNHFAREVLNGKQWLEDKAQAAEERKSRGEPPGFQLVPIAPAKRKYDTTPSSQRLVISGLEAAESKAGVLSTQAKGSVVEDFPPPLTLRGLSSIDQAPASRFLHTTQPRPMSALLSHPRDEEASEGFPPAKVQVSRPAHGPRAGLFSEDRLDVRQAQSLSQQRPQQLPLTLHGDAGHVNSSSRNPPLLPQQQPISNSAQSMMQVQQQTTGVLSPVAQSAYKQQQATALQSSPSHLSHMRKESSSIPASPSQVTLKQEGDMLHPRRELQSHRVAYGQPPAQSSGDARFSDLLTMPEEPLRPSSTPVQAVAEPPKAAPAKRSNIMSILNDEPAEPLSRKRPVADAVSNMSFQPSPVSTYASQSQPQQQTTSQLDDFSGFLQRQQTRSPFLQHPGHIHAQPNANPPTGLLQRHQPPPSHTVGQMGGGPTPSTQLGREWMLRFDPRQSSSSTGGDHNIRGQQPSTMSPYATAPPSSISQSSDHHHQHQPPPPPQLQTSSIPPYQYHMPVQQQHPLRASSPAADHSMVVQQPYHGTPSASSQSKHSRIHSYNHAPQHTTHLQAASVPRPPQPTLAAPANVSRPPSVGYDSRSVAGEPQLQLQHHQSQRAYNYSLQPQQQQPQQWMEDSQNHFRPPHQRHQQRYELQQVERQRQQQHQQQQHQHQPHQHQQQEHIRQQQQQQQQHQRQQRGSAGNQFTTAPPPRTYTPSGGLSMATPVYVTHQQQQQQHPGHMNQHTQSGAGGTEERR